MAVRLTGIIAIMVVISLFAGLVHAEWWNSTNASLGDGSDGVFSFTATSTNFGTLQTPQDYNISGNVVYLNLNRVYQFTEFTLGAGKTVSSTNSGGSVLYILSQDVANISGLINVSDRVLPGNRTDEFIFGSDDILAPGTAQGGDGGSGGTYQSNYGQGGAGGSQANGFGGGGGGGNGGFTNGGVGGDGGYPNGTGGATTNCTTWTSQTGLEGGNGAGGSCG